MIPSWFTDLSIAFLILGAVCMLWVVIDLAAGHRQHMWIMNVVWPITATFGTLFSVWAYHRYGRASSHKNVMRAKQAGNDPPQQRQPFAAKVGKGAAHCGSGCALGDLCAEWLVVAAPVVATWFGWKTLFAADHRIFAVWIIDYLFAFSFGIVFQYFTIAPMRNLGWAAGLKAAVKADTLSLTAWQVGMYGWMAVVHFSLFERHWHAKLKTASVEFWFMMQIAMLVGFLTSYPMNWWLIRSGIKEAM